MFISVSKFYADIIFSPILNLYLDELGGILNRHPLVYCKYS